MIGSRLKAVALIDHFLSKTKRQNEPLQAFWRTDDFASFKKSFATAIKYQATHIAGSLKDAPIPDNYEELTDAQKAVLHSWAARELPPLNELIDESDVENTLISAFSYSVKAQYKRWGLMVKADSTNFELTNQYYLNALKDKSNYLLNKSSIDDTTLDELIDYISEGKADGLTIDELATNLADNFGDISEARAAVIARTETANAMGTGNLAAMTENGVQTKHWVTAGSNPCPICEDNEADGSIGVNDSFSSGDDSEPAHPNCECYTEADEIDLDSIDIWGGE